MMIQFVFILALVSGSVVDARTIDYSTGNSPPWDGGSRRSGFHLGGWPNYDLRLHRTGVDTTPITDTDNVDDDVPVSEKCNLGWLEYEDSCYSFNKETVSWFEAASICQIYGASLVQIESQEENDWLGIQIRRANIVNVWLGGTARLHSNVWEWVPSFRRIETRDTQPGFPDDACNTDSSNLPELLPSSTPLTTFFNWAPGEPNNNDPQGRDESCLEISRHLNYQWNDAACIRHLNFICEKETREIHIDVRSTQLQ